MLRSALSNLACPRVELLCTCGGRRHTADDTSELCVSSEHLDMRLCTLPSPTPPSSLPSDNILLRTFRRRKLDRRKLVTTGAGKSPSEGKENMFVDSVIPTDGAMKDTVWCQPVVDSAPVNLPPAPPRHAPSAPNLFRSAHHISVSGSPYIRPSSSLVADRTASICTKFITGGAFDSLVRLPVGVDMQEWIATNTTAFFAHINSLYGSLTCQFCTPDRCVVMSGLFNNQYTWVDDRGKKSRCTAPQYIDFVMSHVERVLSNEDDFPTKYGNSFPPSFDSTCKRIWRHLWHILAHMHAAHRQHLEHCGLDPALLVLTAHFGAFGREYGLFDEATAKEVASLESLCRDQQEHVVEPMLIDSRPDSPMNVSPVPGQFSLERGHSMAG